MMALRVLGARHFSEYHNRNPVTPLARDPTGPTLLLFTNVTPGDPVVATG